LGGSARRYLELLKVAARNLEQFGQIILLLHLGKSMDGGVAWDVLDRPLAAQEHEHWLCFVVALADGASFA